MEINEEYEVEITDIAFGGDGVARLPEGGVVFVPYAALGDRLRVRLTSVRKTFGYGEILEILSPGPGRCEPVCKHYGICGGCQYQHIGYEEEIAAKRKQLGDLLKRIGGFADLPPIEPCFPAPNPYGYRNKFRLEPFERPRVPEEDGEGVRKVVEYGYYKLDNRSILPIHHCALVCDELNALLKGALKSDWAKQNARRAEKDPALMAAAGEEAPAPAKPFKGKGKGPVARRFRETPGALTMRQTSGDKHAFFFGKAPKNLPWLRETLAGFEYSVPAGSFWQVNPPVASKVVRTVDEWMREIPWLTSLVDAYSGVGTFAAALKSPFVERLLIESDPEATEAAKLNMGQSGFAHQIVSETTEKALPRLLPKFPAATTAVVLDPPRTGCDERVLEALLKSRPRCIAYVSCNPATLARDLKRLAAGGYCLKHLALFDMFPRTAHFETATFLALE